MTTLDRVRALPGAAAAERLLDRFVPRGAIVLSVLTFGYFVAGLVRNRVFANTFGAGAELDAYNAAFRIPEIAFDVLVAAGLTAPFVPIFTSLRRDRDEAAANRFGQTVLTFVVVVMGIAAAVLFVAAPWIGEVIGRDFDPATRALYVELFRINCLAQILFAASFAIGEILVANREFLFYGLAPILYTGGIILGTVLFAGTYGIHATAWGAVAGGLAHLAIRGAGILRTSFRPAIRFQLRTASFREFVRLMLPRMISLPVEPLIFTYFTVFALSFGPGNVSAVNFALDFQVVPVSLIGISFSLAIFPTLSAAFAQGDRAGFGILLGRNVLTIAVLTVLSAAVLFLLSGTLVDRMLGGGAFGSEDVALTSAMVAAFALSIPFDALTYPLARGLYATHNTALQVVASFSGLGTIVVVSQLLAAPVGVLAIPLSYAAGMAVKAGLLGLFLAPRVRRIGSGAGVTEGHAAVA
jgi:putative peptidoglycan lipid II flippase